MFILLSEVFESFSCEVIVEFQLNGTLKHHVSYTMLHILSNWEEAYFLFLSSLDMIWTRSVSCDNGGMNILSNFAIRLTCQSNLPDI